MLQFKSGVRIELTSTAMQRLLFTLADIAIQDDKEYVVTSGNDSSHAVDSRHYTNEAIDVRSHAFTSSYKRDLRSRFEAALGPQFRVLLEDEGKPNEHIHAQVKKDCIYK